MPIITLRVPEDLHRDLRREAIERCTSLNKLCIAKVRNGLNRLQVNRDGYLLESAVTPGAAVGRVAWPGGGTVAQPKEHATGGTTGGQTAYLCDVPEVACKWQGEQVFYPGGRVDYYCDKGGRRCSDAKPVSSRLSSEDMEEDKPREEPKTSSEDTEDDNPVQCTNPGVVCKWRVVHIPGQGAFRYGCTIPGRTCPANPAATIRAEAMVGLRGMIEAAATQLAAEGRGPCRGCRAAWQTGACGRCPGPGYMVAPPPAVPEDTDEDTDEDTPASRPMPAEAATHVTLPDMQRCSVDDFPHAAARKHPAQGGTNGLDQARKPVD